MPFNAQKTLESEFRYFKRKHKKPEYLELEHSSKFIPADMWSRLNRLNNNPSLKVVLEIIRNFETIYNDIKEILKRSHQDISGLFAGTRVNLDDNIIKK